MSDGIDTSRGKLVIWIVAAIAVSAIAEVREQLQREKADSFVSVTVRERCSEDGGEGFVELFRMID